LDDFEFGAKCDERGATGSLARRKILKVGSVDELVFVGENTTFGGCYVI
jgi:hypothetical protein